MCSAEAVKCVQAETGTEPIITANGPGYVVLSFDSKFLGPIADRISLTHSIGTYLGSYDVSDLSGFESIKIPSGTFAVKSKRFEGMMLDIDSQDLVRKLGAALSRTNDVNLKSPQNEVAILLSDRVHVFLRERSMDRSILETRKVSERPFFSPISLHPKYARALINLTGAKRGSIVLDPFCGTGGIVIEAAMMGMKAVASDFDPEMVAGTQENMDYYHLNLYDSEELDISGIGDRFGQVDAVATDPPYGRSTHTGGENIESIYSRAMTVFSETLAIGGAAGVVLPHELKNNALRLEEMHIQRVHGSLSRYYHIFRKD
jgi:tRNA (guanine10-N2)-dimethyltransferase